MRLQAIKDTLRTWLPDYWAMLHPYSEDWDKELNILLDNYQFTQADHFTATINGIEIWTANYPYSYARPWVGINTKTQVRPRKKTILRTKKALDVFLGGYASKKIIGSMLGNSNIVLPNSGQLAVSSSASVTHFINPASGGAYINGPAYAYLDLQNKIESLEKVEAAKVTKPIPDYVHTLTGWRGWIVSEGRLQALGMSGQWEPKKVVAAECLNKLNHICPDTACTCGYWSFKTLSDLKRVLGGYSESVCVIGTVDIWGKVIDCECGFRSEFAYPKELWLLDNQYEFLGPLYGVPIRRM